MLTAKTSKAQPIRLDFRSVEQIVVVPDDEDRFVTTSREAARACKAAEESQEWQKAFTDFLAYLHTRCQELPPQVIECYLDVVDDGLRVFFVTNGEDYVVEIDDQITDIDLALAAKHPVCPLDCVQVPGDSIASFFSLDQAIQVYGERRNPSGKS